MPRPAVPIAPPQQQIVTAGPLAQAGVGRYMDALERNLRQRLRGSGIVVARRGDDLLVTLPNDKLFEGANLGSAGRGLLASMALLGVLLTIVSPVLDALARHAAAPFARAAEGTQIRLAIAALAAGRRRASWGAGAVGVAVALAVAIGTMVHSFRATVIDWTNHYQLWIIVGCIVVVVLANVRNFRKGL